VRCIAVPKIDVDALKCTAQRMQAVFPDFLCNQQKNRDNDGRGYGYSCVSRESSAGAVASAFSLKPIVNRN